ncbi:hypothetical protein NDU88_005470 [Pleurodeles waltl]|uniref:Uncharacterized protein n=1 Tax=Pleurodeles waltl TaxID=8319 RepID=A0AAV7VJ53_PLEWA|nr:hypothetical protein NDU88_005470 [Pleurodeles waltl]
MLMHAFPAGAEPSHAFPGKRRCQLEQRSLRPHASPREQRCGVQSTVTLRLLPPVSKETEMRHPARCDFRR